jgi:glycosyltransferase involved in cell wall biosynthesis
VRVIHQDNCGLGEARNTGIQNSKGRYIYFLDADNVLRPDCLSKLSQLLEENSDAVAAACKIQISGGPTNGMEWAEPYNPYWLLVHNQWDAGIMLRKEAVEKYNLFYDNTRRCHGYEDWELHIRLARTGKPILFYPGPLYQYRVRDNSLLSDARKNYVEILAYIRDKHNDLYAPEQLIVLKRSHAPALLVCGSTLEKVELERVLESQTFIDWGSVANSDEASDRTACYKFYCSTTESIRRLPMEALESAIMALEANPRARHCVIGVTQNKISWLANGGKNTRSQHVGEPIAIIARNTIAEQNIQDILGNCELFIEFPDQRPDIRCAWDSTCLKFSDDNIWKAKDILTLRKRLSLLGGKLLGENIHRRCVTGYDYVYGMLVSERSLQCRATLRRYVGKHGEQALSKAVYGLFLMKPPTEQDSFHWEHLQSSLTGSAPLFLKTNRDDKINILIATSWLNEGGVEQIILDLCRLLDPSRFKVTIATTLPSRQTWDYFARRSGVSIYHLADLLKPNAIPKGLLHLILNQPADCLYIIHSRAAYESLKLFKRIVPWLSIVDRSEVLDPGGGFPLLSARAGNDGIGVRTVGHKKLADYMATEYRLPRDKLHVIYAGTDMERIQNSLSQRRGQLHEICQVSPDTPIVTFIGRFTAQKRPELFIRSVKKCLEMKPECDAHFAMIGDGESRSAVEHLVAEAGLNERIHLLGAHTNAIDLLADSTVLMMPSAYEGLALVSYEAMSLGVPQIFANVNGQSELITFDTGVLIDNGSGEETRYARACLELLSDPDRRARMARAGKERIKSHFTAENAAKQYAEIFEQTAELSRKRASEIPHLRPPHINPLHELA